MLRFMLYKLFALLIVVSCAKIDTATFREPVNMEISLLTPVQQESYSVMKREFQNLFNIQKSADMQCSLDLAISHRTENSGITSTAFAINQTLLFTVFYVFKCDNNWHLEKSITLTNESTPQQEKTVGQYIGEQFFLQEISKRAAREIYDEINLFIALKKQIQT